MLAVTTPLFSQIVEQKHTDCVSEYDTTKHYPLEVTFDLPGQMKNALKNFPEKILLTLIRSCLGKQSLINTILTQDITGDTTIWRQTISAREAK